MPLGHSEQVRLRLFSTDRSQGEEDVPEETRMLSTRQLNQGGNGLNVVQRHQSTDRSPNAVNLGTLQRVDQCTADRRIFAVRQDADRRVSNAEIGCIQILDQLSIRLTDRRKLQIGHRNRLAQGGSECPDRGRLALLQTDSGDRLLNSLIELVAGPTIVLASSEQKRCFDLDVIAGPSLVTALAHRGQLQLEFRGMSHFVRRSILAREIEVTIGLQLFKKNRLNPIRSYSERISIGDRRDDDLDPFDVIPRGLARTPHKQPGQKTAENATPPPH